MFDLTIENGSIIDPERGIITAGTVCVKDGKIAAITREKTESHARIDAAGEIVSPGFIDIHTHIEGCPPAGELIARQGVTTVINGNCGIGPENPSAFIREQNKTGFIVNQLELTGATVLRQLSGQTDPRAPMTPQQIDIASSLLEEQLQDGAAGLSFGLEYMPGSSKEEVLTLSRIAARYGKPVSIHTRSDYYQGLGALDEAISITKITGAPVQISHVVYQYGFGMMRQALDMISDAAAKGYDVSCDSGMYTSFATHIGTEVFSPACFEKWGRSYDAIFMANGRYAGQYLTAETYADARKNHPMDAAIALIGKAHEIHMAFELPYMMVSSDAGVNQSPDTSKGHPQDAGTFPRFLRKLVRETGQLTLVDAIRRITIIPARRMNLQHKGRIAVGADADITVFNADTIKDNARFPHEGKADAHPDGISAVIVAGSVAVHKGKIAAGNAGKAIAAASDLWRF
jgi:N-acyl-D-amino-acid deacylase